jgi:hypothetical protein
MHKLWFEEELLQQLPACRWPGMLSTTLCWLTYHPPCCLLQVETIRSNVIGCLNLADVTNQKGLHMTYYGTGCIFHYDDEFPQGSGKGFKESDKPNFTGSYYSYTKVGVLGRMYLCFWKGAAQLFWSSKCQQLRDEAHPRQPAGWGHSPLRALHKEAAVHSCSQPRTNMLLDRFLRKDCTCADRCCSLRADCACADPPVHSCMSACVWSGHGGEPAEGVPQRADVACAHAHR